MSIKIQNAPNRAAFDVQASQDLRETMRKDPKAGLKAAAQQFETMFLQMVMKSMRDTVPDDGLLSSDQTRFYNGLLDQQMAQNMATSGKGVGFAQLIEKQLGASLGNITPEAAAAPGAAALGALLTQAASFAGQAAAPAGPQASGQNATPPASGLRYQEVLSSLPTSAAYAAAADKAQQANAANAVAGADTGDARGFVERLWPDAVNASRTTGIPPQFLIAHAALESGWGKSEIRKADGSSSHNLFGIKAGKSWNGDSVLSRTTEYVDGQAQGSIERFRSYGSYAEAFQDYARLLRDNPRYSTVIGSQNGTEFASRLQQAGYATDPNYANKLSRIIDGPTLRQALIG